MKNKMILLPAMLLFFGLNHLPAQQNQRFPITVTVFNTATLLPGSAKLGVFGIPVHPGLTLGTEYTYKKGPKHEMFQTLRLGYFYHRYIQHGIQLYSEIGYRYHFNTSWDIGTRLGMGYLHAFNDRGQFEINDKGVYEKLPNTGRPQFMGAFSLGPGYTFSNEMRVFLHYQFALQLPFINEYVPVMPSSNVHIGVTIPWR
ncbi:MAG: hypothetical protein KDC85_04055 [Saprospiraceae bacterium]|nr:hypothetical protein [Saprospiraceae bacterium]MCB9324055.1 hypothetical protein [Lewinellaceae bacterium]